jgi:hypothetical protein
MCIVARSERLGRRNHGRRYAHGEDVEFFGLGQQRDDVCLGRLRLEQRVVDERGHTLAAVAPH